jgi:hypothetical protein
MILPRPVLISKVALSLSNELGLMCVSAPQLASMSAENQPQNVFSFVSTMLDTPSWELAVTVEVVVRYVSVQCVSLEPKYPRRYVIGRLILLLQGAVVETHGHCGTLDIKAWRSSSRR